ncbi:heme-dependent oxidative N-demethylase family protein [Prosthecomicrobium sp. N25]|uniref:heme-dependent oxidative N-demethylase family protein n=1 Tax=Prosthecomicrobium sp. N25 TaxID=3129254 RepID=UPI0030786717
MPTFAHTPYDGSKKPFSIGLSPIPEERWLEPDERLLVELAEKDALLAEKRDVVFRAEPDTEASQREVLDAILAHLLARHPDRYRWDRDHILVDGSRSVPLSAAEPALATAARLVQDDLVLMRPGGAAGYRLVAAALCFPSAWSLAEKFGASLDGLHGNVPGYAEHLGVRMKRIFEGLKPGIIVERLNWSIYPDAELHHPESKERPRDWFGMDRSAFIRVERQTLRRMPASGDILFTIRVLVDPFGAFETHPDGRRLAAGLRAQLLALDPDQLRYKNLQDHRDLVAAELARIAGLSGP